MSTGLLLAFPLESVAVRLALAFGVALVMVRVISSWDLRSPRARTVLAVSPFAVAMAIIMASSGNLGLPTLLVPSGVGPGSLALPIDDRYLEFAPMAPVLVGVWVTVSLLLISLRLVRSVRYRRALLSAASPVDPRIAAVVLRLSRSLGVLPPRALVVERGVGGAAVLGVRDPVVVIDRHTFELLDDEELEGVLAHELAHVARRDNLVAWAVAVVRDIAFFVPGSTWAVRALHRERESAADLDAVGATGRPAALASGLLRVVEHARAARRAPAGCAALVGPSAVVGRVEMLLSDERPTAREHRLELALAAAISLVAIAAAIALPAHLAGEGQRDALGVLLGATGDRAEGPLDHARTQSRVFAVYRSLDPGSEWMARPTGPSDIRGADIIGPEDRPGMAQACAMMSSGCVTTAANPGLMLRPSPIVLIGEATSARWQATPVAENVGGDRFGVYWLSRLDHAVSAR